MKLHNEIICKEIGEIVLRTFHDINIDYKEIIDLKSYEALSKIKTIIEDDSLTDEECFLHIEEIICVFETLGSSGGNRHDF